MVNIKLILQYDGSAYIGWQRQRMEHGQSVQQVVEDALALVVGRPVTIHGAGRTDSGVHALAQVAHFVCPVAIPTDKLPVALNNILPADIRITGAEEVDDSFHARFSARGKRYRYLLAADEPTAFNYRWYWFLKQLPQVEPMMRAASYLVGEHDFRHFTLSKSTAKNFTRELRTVCVYQPTKGELPCPLNMALAIEVEGNGFLYKMVRLIAARMVAIGRGKLPPNAMKEYLTGRSLPSIPPAPPQGLMLMEVNY